MMLEETQSLESQRQPPQGLSCGGLWGLPGASQRPSKWVSTRPSLWAPGLLVCLCKAGDLCYLPVALPLPSLSVQVPGILGAPICFSPFLGM